MTTLTDEHLNAIDDALMTGASIDVSTAAAIASRYGVDITLEATEARQRIVERYHHPTVGPTGRRALDALLAYLQTQP